MRHGGVLGWASGGSGEDASTGDVVGMAHLHLSLTSSQFWNPPLTEQAERARQMGLRVPSHTESRATFKEREAARKARSRSVRRRG